MSPSDKKLAQVFKGAPQLVIATVALMEELVRVLRREMDIVTSRKIEEHPALLKYKQKLASDYGANFKALSEQPDLVKKLSTEARAAFNDMAKRLVEASNDNARILRAAIGATQQLIQNFMVMIRQEVTDKHAYNNPAKAHLQLGLYSPTCAPVAINRSV